MKNNEVSVKELEQMFQSDSLFVCLDVRDRGEFAYKGQIPGSIPLPRGSIEKRVERMIPHYEVPIIVCCDDGDRSKLAQETLKNIGYQDVKILAGGINEWKRQGLSTITGWGVHGKKYGEEVSMLDDITQINAQELNNMYQNDNILVVDVRTEEEYFSGHLPHAYHVPGGKLLLELPALIDANPDLTVITCCAGRTRSILGAHMLNMFGYKKVLAVENGLMGWWMAGYELEIGKEHHLQQNHSKSKLEKTLIDHFIKNEGVNFVDMKDIRSFSEKNEPYYLIDLRQPPEFKKGHIPHSSCLPVGEIAIKSENTIALKKAKIVLISDDDIRPIYAASLMKNLGYSDVSVLKGGLTGWVIENKNTPLEVGDGGAQEIFGLEHAQNVAQSVSLQQFDQLKDNEQTTILDVRGCGNYGVGHIPGSLWVSRGQLEFQIEQIVPDKTSPITTVSTLGKRAALAAATLIDLGYKNVNYLEGGLSTWINNGRDLENNLNGADVTVEEAQFDFGKSVWSGGLKKTRTHMENYLTWEVNLVKEK